MKRAFASIGIVFLALLAGFAAPRATGAERSTEGQLLVASEQLQDPRFYHTVIYMCRHDAEGAFGLVLNRLLGRVPLDKLLGSLGIPSQGGETIAIRKGGPVEPALGFVLHSDDYQDPDSICHRGGVEVTASKDVFAAMAEGGGPAKRVILFGYAGWGAGQLESELRRKDWVVVPADAGIVFDGRPEGLWERARARRGIDL